MVYGAFLPACADHRTGRRTVANPAFLIAVKYSALSFTPHSPSLGASRALPRLMPRPRFPFAAMTPFAGSSVAKANVLVTKTPRIRRGLIAEYSIVQKQELASTLRRGSPAFPCG